MGFWDTLGKVASIVMEEGAKKQAEMERRAGNQVKNYERKVADAEKSVKMNDPAYAREVNETKQKLVRSKVKIYTGEESESNIVKVDSSGQVVIDGKTIDCWESK